LPQTSINEESEIQCPNCNQKQEQVIYRSINVKFDPELRNDLFEGDINRFNCKYCQHTSIIPVSLLYHDMDREFAVHFFPSESMKKDKFLEKFDENGKMIIEEDKIDFDPPEYMYDVQVVFQMDEMLNYILFREYLHDYHNKN